MHVFFFHLASGLVLALVAISCRLCTLGTNLSIKKNKKQKKKQSPPAAVNIRAVGSTILAVGAVSATSHSRPVMVRVLSGTTYPRPPVREDKVNFNVKIFNPENKKEQHVFVLRDVTQAVASTPETLMEELRR